MGFHHKVVNELQLHELLSAALWFVEAFVAGPVVDDVIVNFSETGGNGSQLGRNSPGQVVPRILQALAYELARSINVGAILKDQGDLRQPELG